MELSKKDRLLLINQYTLLKQGAPENAEYYDEMIEILQNGYSIYYSLLDAWISDDMPNEEGQLVLDILSIYSMIEEYKRNKPDDHEISRHKAAIFKGFNADLEAQYFCFTNFLIERQQKFGELQQYSEQTFNFNSEEPQADKYRRMIEIWTEHDKPFETNRERLLDLLDA